MDELHPSGCNISNKWLVSCLTSLTYWTYLLPSVYPERTLPSGWEEGGNNPENTASRREFFVSSLFNITEPKILWWYSASCLNVLFWDLNAHGMVSPKVRHREAVYEKNKPRITC